MYPVQCVRDDVTSISRVIIMLRAEKGWYFFLGSDTCQGRAFVSPRGSAPTVNTPSTGACCSVCARTWKCIRMYTRVNMYYTGCSSSGDGGNNIITTAYVRTG